MTGLVAQVLQYITDHPECSLTRIQEEIRAPALQVEHVVGMLKREGRITQSASGKWLGVVPRRLSSEEEALESRRDERHARGLEPKAPARPRRTKRMEDLPEGKKRCVTCERVKWVVEFYSRTNKCRRCYRDYQREYQRRMRQRPAPSPECAEMMERVLGEASA